MNGYVKTFKDKDGDKNKNKNSKFMSFRIDDNRLFKKHKNIWTEIEYLQNTALNALPVYDGRCMKAKIRTYGNKFYTNFRGLNLPRECVEYKSFAIISIDSVLVYENKYYMQVYLETVLVKL